ncbi:MAG: lactate utilization protein [Methanoculleus sp.]|nr:lactate utilization protein [Methanoculleus sp.]
MADVTGQQMAKPTEYSAVNMAKDAGVDTERWNRVPDEATIKRTAEAVEARNIGVILVDSAEDALRAVIDLLPEGAEVMNGYSTTLVEMGFDRVLKENPKGWRDYHAVVTAENDTEKRHALRRKSVAADYFLSGVQAIAESGEIVGCDKTGSRMGAWPHAAAHLVLVSGTNKIVPTVDDALRRCREYCLPLENQRSQHVYGMGSYIGKHVILDKEDADGRITLVLIKERLGY